MIKVGISYGFGAENRYYAESIPSDIQLATYKYNLYKANEYKIIKALEEAKTNVLTVHLPIDTTRMPNSEVVIEMMDLFYNRFKCTEFILHPNKGFNEFVIKWWNRYKSTPPYKLCIETFQWKKKKDLRSPLDIMEYCIRFNTFTMCIDTSHIEEIWFDYKIMSKLLQYTSVIHLSNRAKGISQHMPFNSQDGELNLVAFVKDLKKRYFWEGTIILEYMHTYQDKIRKNCEYVKRLVNE